MALSGELQTKVIQTKGSQRFRYRALSWLKAATTPFTFKTLFRQYASRGLSVIAKSSHNLRLKLQLSANFLDDLGRYEYGPGTTSPPDQSPGRDVKEKTGHKIFHFFNDVLFSQRKTLRKYDGGWGGAGAQHVHIVQIVRSNT